RENPADAGFCNGCGAALVAVPAPRQQQALAKTDRAQLHETFARWLEEHGTELVELDEITGYHLEQAFGYRSELGPADEQARLLAAGAAGHLDAAGQRAMDRGDTGAAVNLLERAEALLPAQELNLRL